MKRRMREGGTGGAKHFHNKLDFHVNISHLFMYVAVNLRL